MVSLKYSARQGLRPAAQWTSVSRLAKTKLRACSPLPEKNEALQAKSEEWMIRRFGSQTLTSHWLIAAD